MKEVPIWEKSNQPSKKLPLTLASASISCAKFLMMNVARLFYGLAVNVLPSAKISIDILNRLIPFNTPLKKPAGRKSLPAGIYIFSFTR